MLSQSIRRDPRPQRRMRHSVRGPKMTAAIANTMMSSRIGMKRSISVLLPQPNNPTISSTDLREPVQRFRILHEDAASCGLTRRPLLEKVKQDGIVRFGVTAQTWVRPVAPPHQPFWRGLYKRLR